MYRSIATNGTSVIFRRDLLEPDRSEFFGFLLGPAVLVETWLWQGSSETEGYCCLFCVGTLCRQLEFLTGQVVEEVKHLGLRKKEAARLLKDAVVVGVVIGVGVDVGVGVEGHRGKRNGN